jgi:carbonic anhydrase
MHDKSKKTRAASHLNRRKFLTLPPAAVAAAVLAEASTANRAHADALTKEQRDRLTAEEILAVMKRGNLRFRNGEEPRRDFLVEQKASAKGQYPATVLLSCIDSRAPAEVIMDLGLGNAFNCRVAGNIANEDILGSMEFACKVTGAKVVLVMGHTSCGAIKGAIDNVELGNLTGLLAKIRPAVAATAYTGQRTSKNLEFVDAVARTNVTMTMAQILAKSSVLRELEAKGAIKIARAMYNLETATVEFFQ